ncbi:MAG: enoyl-CoA hydratase-related protein [Pseudomonadales bacterium]|jgi:enoyl-CoA hydratase/carnithine racemase|nr:enoyl-CoA hydratase-related protein [Pseudomonadales bacterium]MDP6471818.1 enoyl-CoA hydratase-related protein [Pseudomonadales bacterium]MDP6828768.1 enoyl-CoA hydratase-related protein [Pseudomonadales bacterium]MDP6970299.1 enoyl-CoA hydratase-related protein [Pseudomonadales bacterium]|tara:strand:- start:793 stop:1542 length:750 start_codon:yes stop_codon:yes gene_type:complete
MSDIVTYSSESSEDRIATITINRAEKMNAMNDAVILGLHDAFTRYAESDDRVAVLHAAGDRAFSVGADVTDAPREMWMGVPSIGVQLDKPVIAAVHGWCIGGAYVIVQMCDMVIASETTVFKYPEAQLGFTGGLIASSVARIPHKVAMEFMLLGEDFPAERALQAGMVNKVVAKGTELEEAMKWATILANSAPLVVTTIKHFSQATMPKSPAEAGAISRERLLNVRNSEDGAEGGRAFREKRTPEFKGR